MPYLRAGGNDVLFDRCEHVLCTTASCCWFSQMLIGGIFCCLPLGFLASTAYYLRCLLACLLVALVRSSCVLAQPAKSLEDFRGNGASQPVSSASASMSRQQPGPHRVELAISELGLGEQRSSAHSLADRGIDRIAQFGENQTESIAFIVPSAASGNKVDTASSQLLPDRQSL